MRRLPFALSLSLLACGPATQSFPLEIAPEDVKPVLGELEACARKLGHEPKVSAKSVRIEPATGQRVAFVATEDGVTMDTWVATDGDRGQLPKLKVLGDALWECAEKGPATKPTASASAAPAPPPPPPPPPPPAPPPPPPPPPPVPTVAPSASAVGGCEEDATCAKPPGASCERNEDCASQACAKGTCM